ncbi:MAG: ATP phosphoribosyltransferase [Robiginitomaculum sp.]|nr:ATP phosphoribosyltransferase [Robiginitomaculum sp.]
MSERLTIAIQKKGRLADESFSLLRKSGLHFTIPRGGLLARVTNMPVDLLLVRDDDIPSFVASSASDIGIVGENVLAEAAHSATSPFDASIALRLGFSRCKLCLAGLENGEIKSINNLENTTIATSYPGILNHFLRENKITASTVEMKGAVELAPSIGIAQSICDLVSSGATLEANGLSAFATIFHSEAVLVGSSRPLSADKQACLDRLVRRFAGVIQSAETKYIMMNAPKAQLAEITRLLPGSDAPTVIPLAGNEDLVAVQAVCTETVFWETLEDLKALGARAILVLPIEKMMS